MDPLSVLREFSIAKQLDQIHVDDTRVRFGERYSFPKSVPTGYRRHGGGVYDLNTLVYLLKQPANYAWLTYIRNARAAGIPQVAFPDRKELNDYLTGAIEHSDKIQLTAPELVLPPSVGEDAEEPSAKRAKVDQSDTVEEPADVAAEVVPVLAAGKERPLRDRNSQMSIPGKNFRQVMEILHMAERQREQRERAQKVKPPAAVAKPKEKRAAIPVMPSGRFDRPAEQNPRSAFRIPTAATQPPAPPPLPSEPPPPPTSQPRPPSAGSLRPARPSIRQPPPKPQAKPSSSKSGGKQRPIIIVPAAPSAKLTMLNIKSFLERGVFTPPEVARREGAKKESHTVIYRRFNRPTPVAYEVTDKAPPKKSHDWRRVVAVFVTGAAWQFKDWPYKGADKGEMADSFFHVLGIHVGLKNEKVPDTVKTWNVKRFTLHPHERHGDQSVVLEIYAAIDQFLAKKQKSEGAAALQY